MGIIEKFLLGIRKKETWYQRLLYNMAIKLRILRMPFPRFFGAVFFYERRMRLVAWRRLKQFLYYEPMFRYRCAKVGKGLYIETSCPIISGYGSVYVGDRVLFSGHVSFAVSYKVNADPVIEIGNDVYVGYATCFSSAERITLGNNILIAAGVHIYDNNNHPLDPQARRENKPVEKENIAPVTIEDDVWIGSNAVILKGVTVGRGSIVAIASVVSKDVPPMSIVAGNPAKVVKRIESVSEDFKITEDGDKIGKNDSEISGAENE